MLPDAAVMLPDAAVKLLDWTVSFNVVDDCPLVRAKEDRPEKIRNKAMSILIFIDFNRINKNRVFIFTILLPRK